MFHQSSSDAIIVNDKKSACALDKVLTLASEALCEKNLPTSIMPEETLGKRIDLRISSQPEVPHTEDETAGTTFLVSSLTKQVLNSPNKSMRIADVIKNYGHIFLSRRLGLRSVRVEVMRVQVNWNISGEEKVSGTLPMRTREQHAQKLREGAELRVIADGAVSSQ